MKSNSTPQPAREKKPYHKPEIEKVSLVIEEAVLGTSCRFAENSDGPGMAGCDPATMNPCPIFSQ